MSKKRNTGDGVLMQITKQSGFGNTSIVGTVTLRRAATLTLILGVGLSLMKTPLFRWNWFAMIAYVAFASIILGQTPTGRNILTNIYGILFKKPPRMIITEDMSVTTVGHGIREIILDKQGIDAIPIQMASTKNYALVYNITSGINLWSTDHDKMAQALRVKSLFNILEGGESLIIVEKQDNDTGMLKLREDLLASESFEGDDLQAMSDTRASLLYSAGTSDQGRSIQQYAVLLVKPKNVNRVTKALRNASRITRPATNPLDVLFAMMGFEGGVEWSHNTTRAAHKAKQEEGQDV